MKRFWISWYSQGNTKIVPFKYWITGESAGSENVEFTYVADIKAESEDKAYDKIGFYFPDYRERFCKERDEDWTPSDRFQ